MLLCFEVWEHILTPYPLSFLGRIPDGMRGFRVCFRVTGLECLRHSSLIVLNAVMNYIVNALVF